MDLKHETELRGISEWLETLGKNREWLANELGVSIATINGWYSMASGRPIPTPTMRLIQTLMRDRQMGEPRFTFTESKRVIKAMEVANYVSFPEFARDAVSAKVESILNPNLEIGVPISLVADPQGDYPATQ